MQPAVTSSVARLDPRPEVEPGAAPQFVCPELPRKIRIGNGSIELDLDLLEVRRDGRTMELPALPLRLLIHLLRNRHRVVPRTELLGTLWPETHISDCALTSAVRDVRRALGDSGRDQRIVRTLRGRGVRLVAPVRPTLEPAAPARVEHRTESSWSDSGGDPDAPASQGILRSGLAELLHRERAGARVTVLLSPPERPDRAAFRADLEGGPIRLAGESGGPSGLFVLAGAWLRALADRARAEDAAAIEGIRTELLADLTGFDSAAVRLGVVLARCDELAAIPLRIEDFQWVDRRSVDFVLAVFDQLLRLRAPSGAL